MGGPKVTTAHGSEEAELHVEEDTGLLLGAWFPCVRLWPSMPESEMMLCSSQLCLSLLPQGSAPGSGRTIAQCQGHGLRPIPPTLTAMSSSRVPVPSGSPLRIPRMVRALSRSDVPTHLFSCASCTCPSPRIQPDPDGLFCTLCQKRSQTGSPKMTKSPHHIPRPLTRVWQRHGPRQPTPLTSRSPRTPISRASTSRGSMPLTMAWARCS